MNKKLYLYSILSVLLAGSFLGSHFWRQYSRMPGDSVIQAKNLIDGAQGDQEKLARASDLLQRELSANPANLTARFLQGRALQQRGLIDAALESYRRYFQEKISFDYAANYNAGELYELKGDFLNAERHFLECIAVAPGEDGGWERAIRLLLNQNRHKEAKELFDALGKQSPASEALKRLAPAMQPV